MIAAIAHNELLDFGRPAADWTLIGSRRHFASDHSHDQTSRAAVSLEPCWTDSAGCANRGDRDIGVS